MVVEVHFEQHLTVGTQDKKMQDWNLEDNFAGLENAGAKKISYTKYK